jgi:antitoxin YqcF
LRDGSQMTVSPANKAIAKHVLKAFGGTPKVQAYHHDTISMSVDILRCADRPWSGVTSYSTIGLSDFPMLKHASEFPVRLEIAGASASSNELFPNVLASVAFSIMRTRGLYAPGTSVLDFVREYYPSTTVPHLYFTAPYLWNDSLNSLDCGTKKVSWLLLVPISDTELSFLKQHGDDALEDLFEKNDIDIFDLHRTPVV